ncbi:MAG: hypothetical protein EOP45_01270 [Sphingobacteriaceae bacterium]|nr:MAG: hypothetical protein EOP45_01270 [Sphingobacteriaceae bacterium]
MARVKFNSCLNKETKYYNTSLGTLVGGGVCGFVTLVIKGLVWSFVVGGIGMYLGSWLGTQWWLGNIQRWVYWQLPVSNWLFKSKLPKSYERNLI